MQLTVKQAVLWLINSLTEEYRKECLQFWRERFGDRYADEVHAKFVEDWKNIVKKMKNN
jgi:uncharacterized protein YecA (UPF0149 family)